MNKANRLSGLLSLLFATSLMVLIPGGARAAEGSADEGRADEPAGWTPVQRLTFGDDAVEGTRLGPDGERLEATTKATHCSLIELRESFVAEIAKSMEDL